MKDNKEINKYIKEKNNKEYMELLMNRYTNVSFMRDTYKDSLERLTTYLKEKHPIILEEYYKDLFDEK